MTLYGDSVFSGDVGWKATAQSLWLSNNTGPLSTLHVRCCRAGSACRWVLSARRVLLEERPRLVQLCSHGRGDDEVDSETLKQDTWLEQGGSNEV